MLATTLAACDKTETTSGATSKPATAAAKTTTAKAGPAGTTAAANVPARANPTPAAGGALTVNVAAGATSGGVWTPAFELRRVASDTNKGYLEAMQHCRDQNLMLCSTTQWERACATNAAVGKITSWTASWAGQSVALRGGDGCAATSVAAGSSKAESRAGLCCQRAIGIRGNSNASFRTRAHSEQLNWENALNTQDIGAIGKNIDVALEFDGTVLPRDKAINAQKAWWKAHPKQWTFFDVCDVKIADAWNPRPGMGRFFKPTTNALVHDCKTVAALGNKLTVVKMRFGRLNTDDGKTNKVVEIKHHARTRKLAPL